MNSIPENELPPSAAVSHPNLEIFWDDYAEHFSFLHESRVYQQLVAETLALARAGRGMRCLDIGCGPGNYCLALAASGAVAVGVDSSQKMIAIARKNIRKSHLPEIDIQLKRMDALEYLKTVPDNSFDVVIAALFLAYVRNHAAVIREVCRVLKPGGRFVMSNPKPEANFSRVWLDSIYDILRKPLKFLPVSIRIWTYAKRIEGYSRRGVFNFFKKAETHDLLASAGFDSGNIQLHEAFSGQVYLVRAQKSPR